LTTSNQEEVAAEDYQNTSKNGNQARPRKLHIPAANWTQRQPKFQQETTPTFSKSYIQPTRAKETTLHQH
jgi:hypothetical protein